MSAQPAPVRALEARYYTDPDIYAREHEGLFLRSWQFAGHASRIPNAGDFFCVEVAGEALFCIRGRDGAVRTFYNVCQHRAHPLVEGSGCRKLLVCPYHAWTYNLDGTLRGAPNLDSVAGVDRTSIRLTEVRTESFHGFLFVNLDDDAEPMDVWFPGTRAEIARFVPDIDALQELEWIRIPEACNWKVSVENYSECYHCALNHKTFVTGVVRPETYDIQPGPGFVLRHTTECQNLDRMSYPIDLARSHAGDYLSLFLWPTFSFQIYPGNVLNTYHWRPDGPDRVIVWRGWFTGDGRDPEVVRALARQDRETTVEEDLRLVEAVQRGLRSRGYRPGPLVLDPACGLLSEHSIRALHDWMRDAASSGCATERSVAGQRHDEEWR